MVRGGKCGLALGLLLVLSLTLGCGKSREYGSVYGEVTLQGQPLSEGTIIFADEEWASFVTAPIRNGEYAIEATDNSGLYIGGQYKVAVVPVVPAIPMGQVKPTAPAKPHSPIPPKYRDWKTSGQQMSLTSRSAAFNIDMKP